MSGGFMANLSKRSTIYFEPTIHQALKMRAASSNSTISELVDEAVRQLMLEDQEDLQAINDRVNEKEVTYETMLAELKADGKI
jgi:hypothetical protein